jgi:hypothetical protein
MVSPGFCGTLVADGADGAGFSGPLMPQAGSNANVSTIAESATARAVKRASAMGLNACANSRNMATES